jgi:hypothetical protein
MPLAQTLEVHALSGAYVVYYASGLGAENIGMANTQRLLMNQMTYTRTQISRNEKRKRKKELQFP